MRKASTRKVTKTVRNDDPSCYLPFFLQQQFNDFSSSSSSSSLSNFTKLNQSRSGLSMSSSNIHSSALADIPPVNRTPVAKKSQAIQAVTRKKPRIKKSKHSSDCSIPPQSHLEPAMDPVSPIFIDIVKEKKQRKRKKDLNEDGFVDPIENKKVIKKRKSTPSTKQQKKLSNGQIEAPQEEPTEIVKKRAYKRKTPGEVKIPKKRGRKPKNQPPLKMTERAVAQSSTGSGNEKVYFPFDNSTMIEKCHISTPVYKEVEDNLELDDDGLVFLDDKDGFTPSKEISIDFNDSHSHADSLSRARKAMLQYSKQNERTDFQLPKPKSLRSVDLDEDDPVEELPVQIFSFKREPQSTCKLKKKRISIWDEFSSSESKTMPFPNLQLNSFGIKKEKFTTCHAPLSALKDPRTCFTSLAEELKRQVKKRDFHSKAVSSGDHKNEKLVNQISNKNNEFPSSSSSPSSLIPESLSSVKSCHLLASAQGTKFHITNSGTQDSPCIILDDSDERSSIATPSSISCKEEICRTQLGKEESLHLQQSTTNVSVADSSPKEESAQPPLNNEMSPPQTFDVHFTRVPQTKAQISECPSTSVQTTGKTRLFGELNDKCNHISPILERFTSMSGVSHPSHVSTSSNNSKCVPYTSSLPYTRLSQSSYQNHPFPSTFYNGSHVGASQNLYYPHSSRCVDPRLDRQNYLPFPYNYPFPQFHRESLNVEKSSVPIPFYYNYPHQSVNHYSSYPSYPNLYSFSSFNSFHNCHEKHSPMNSYPPSATPYSMTQSLAKSGIIFPGTGIQHFPSAESYFPTQSSTVAEKPLSNRDNVSELSDCVTSASSTFQSTICDTVKAVSKPLSLDKSREEKSPEKHSNVADLNNQSRSTEEIFTLSKKLFEGFNNQKTFSEGNEESEEALLSSSSPTQPSIEDGGVTDCHDTLDMSHSPLIVSSQELQCSELNDDDSHSIDNGVMEKSDGSISTLDKTLNESNPFHSDSGLESTAEQPDSLDTTPNFYSSTTISASPEYNVTDEDCINSREPPISLSFIDQSVMRYEFLTSISNSSVPSMESPSLETVILSPTDKSPFSPIFPPFRKKVPRKKKAKCLQLKSQTPLSLLKSNIVKEISKCVSMIRRIKAIKHSSSIKSSLKVHTPEETSKPIQHHMASLLSLGNFSIRKDCLTLAFYYLCGNRSFWKNCMDSANKQFQENATLRIQEKLPLKEKYLKVYDSVIQNKREYCVSVAIAVSQSRDIMKEYVKSRHCIDNMKSEHAKAAQNVMQCKFIDYLQTNKCIGMVRIKDAIQGDGKQYSLHVFAPSQFTHALMRKNAPCLLKHVTKEHIPYLLFISSFLPA